DLLDVAAQRGPAGLAEVVDVQGVVGPDGEDLRAAGGIEPGADLLGISPQRDPAGVIPIDVDAVVAADAEDRPMLQAAARPADRAEGRQERAILDHFDHCLERAWAAGPDTSVLGVTAEAP